MILDHDAAASTILVRHVLPRQRAYERQRRIASRPELRENLTAYDATFVALAEALDVPLVTCDARLAAAPGHRARIEVYDNRA